MYLAMTRDSILTTTDKNLSSVYITPMLGGTRKLFFFNKYHVNTFIFVEGHGPCIALYYKSSTTTLFKKFLDAVEQFRMYVETVDYKDHVLIIFEVPIDHEGDFVRLIEGKYSEFSVILKDKILKFHGPSQYLVGVLYKSSQLHAAMEKNLQAEIPEDSELESIPDINNESFFI